MYLGKFSFFLSKWIMSVFKNYNGSWCFCSNYDRWSNKIKKFTQHWSSKPHQGIIHCIFFVPNKFWLHSFCLTINDMNASKSVVFFHWS